MFKGGELVGKVERVEGSLVVYREFVHSRPVAELTDGR